MQVLRISKLNNVQIVQPLTQVASKFSKTTKGPQAKIGYIN